MPNILNSTINLKLQYDVIYSFFYLIYLYLERIYNKKNTRSTVVRHSIFNARL